MNLTDAISGLADDLKESNDRYDRMVLVREAQDAIRAAVALNPTRFIRAIATEDWADVGVMFGWAWRIQRLPDNEYEPETPEPKRKPSDEELEGISFDRSRI